MPKESHQEQRIGQVPSLTVFFDHQAFHLQSSGGISRYFCELAAGLQFLPGMHPVVFGGICRNRHLLDLRNSLGAATVFHYRRDRLRINTVLGQIARLWGRWLFLRLERRGPVLYHPTYYDPDPFIQKRACGTVLTFFDMIPEWLAEQDRSAKAKALPVRKKAAFDSADGVLAISEATRRDLGRHYGEGALAKVRVTHLASSLQGAALEKDSGPAARASESKPEGGPALPASFFLFVGNRAGYKNGGQVLAAFAALARGEPECHLLLFGGEPLDGAEAARLSELGIAQRTHQLQGDDRLLVQCYRQAAGLVYPSGYEGFGLPVLEAMQLGCPVIASNNSSIPEVGGDAVVYTDGSPEQLTPAMLKLLNDPPFRQELIERGKIQSARFSWRTTALQTARLYRKLA